MWGVGFKPLPASAWLIGHFSGPIQCRWRGTVFQPFAITHSALDSTSLWETRLCSVCIYHCAFRCQPWYYRCGVSCLSCDCFSFDCRVLCSWPLYICCLKNYLVAPIWSMHRWVYLVKHRLLTCEGYLSCLCCPTVRVLVTCRELGRTTRKVSQLDCGSANLMFDRYSCALVVDACVPCLVWASR